MYKKKN